MEMYTLTKSKQIFANKIMNVDLLIWLMKIDVSFFQFSSDILLYTHSDVLKIIKTFPEIRHADNIPKYIMEDYTLVSKTMTNLNSIKTFLLSVKKMEGFNPFSCDIQYIVCSYLSDELPYELLERFIGKVPAVLQTKCRCRKHVCSHCSELKHIRQEIEAYNQRPQPLGLMARMHFNRLIRGEHLVQNRHCHGKPYNCINCLKSEDRRSWFRTIRDHACVYGIQVV